MKETFSCGKMARMGRTCCWSWQNYDIQVRCRPPLSLLPLRHKLAQTGSGIAAVAVAVAVVVVVVAAVVVVVV